MRARLSTFRRWAHHLQRSLLPSFRRTHLYSDERGVTSIEFAIVSVPLIGIIFVIVETGLVLLSQHVLDTAVQDASRKIMTGEAQNSGFNAAQFKAEVCSRVKGFVDCGNGVYIDVRNYSSPAPAPVKPIKNGVFDPSGFGYAAGGPNCIMVVTAAIEYPGFTQLLGQLPKELNNGKQVLVSSASFRNEPYVNNAGLPACTQSP